MYTNQASFCQYLTISTNHTNEYSYLLYPTMCDIKKVFKGQQKGEYIYCDRKTNGWKVDTNWFCFFIRETNTQMVPTHPPKVYLAAPLLDEQGRTGKQKKSEKERDDRLPHFITFGLNLKHASFRTRREALCEDALCLIN